MNKYIHNNKWLTMSTDVFVDIVNDQCMLLYNTQSGIYKVTQDKSLIEIVKILYEPKNMGAIEATTLEGNTSNDVTWALNNNFIKLTEDKGVKPIIFLPILNLQDDLTRKDENGIEGRIRLMGSKTKYISGVHIRLSNIKKDGCHKKYSDRNHAAIMYPCPSYSATEDVMSKETLSLILNKIEPTSTSIVDIICSASYFENTSFEELANTLLNFSFSYRIHMYADDVSNSGIVLKNCNNELKAVFTFYGDIHGDSNDLSHFVSDIENVKRIQLIYNESDIIGHEHQSLLPVWTDSNKDFFKNNVWLDKSDIDNSIADLNSIFRNQKLNANFFGIIDIDTLGNVYAHGSSSIISNVYSTDFSFAKVVSYEFIENNSWRLTRDILKNCSSCPLRFICPPVSFPELLNKETKMCNIVV